MKTWLWSLLGGLLLAGSAQAALLFDRVNDYILTATATGGTFGYPFTVAAVVTMPVIDTTQALFQLGVYLPGGQNGWIWYPTSAGGLSGVYNSDTDTGVSVTGSVPANTWVFVAWSSASATSHRGYCWNYQTLTEVFNATTTTNLNAITTPATSHTIGAQREDTATFTTHWGGTVAWLAVYNVDMTGLGGDHLRAMRYQGPYASGTPALLYTFDEMTGTTLRERRGVGGAGTLTNFPAAPWVPMGLPGPLMFPH